MQKYMSPFQGAGRITSTMIKETHSISANISYPIKPTLPLNNTKWFKAPIDTADPIKRLDSVNLQSKKRPATSFSNNLESSEEPIKKKLILNDSNVTSAHDLFNKIQLKNHIGAKNEIAPTKMDKSETPAYKKEMRLLSGNVGEVLKFVKRFPTLNAIYEVYSNILKIEEVHKPGERKMLLRNDGGGPVLQGVYYEIDFKMCEIKIGDAVRCVGKFLNSSRLIIYKIAVIDTDTTSTLVPRLNSIANFVLDK